jgi:hypothetical protein
MADGRSGSCSDVGIRGGKSGHRRAACPVKAGGRPGASPASRTVSQKTDRPESNRGARVKRRGKSPPPREQSRGQDKPHAVQDKTGGTGCPPAPDPQGPRGNLRVMVAQINDRPGSAQAPTDRIRLTAIAPNRGRTRSRRSPPAFPAPPGAMGGVDRDAARKSLRIACDTSRHDAKPRGGKAASNPRCAFRKCAFSPGARDFFMDIPRRAREWFSPAC